MISETYKKALIVILAAALVLMMVYGGGSMGNGWMMSHGQIGEYILM